MLTIAEIEPHIEAEFGARLEPLGFQRLGKRTWLRSEKKPIREIFGIGMLKGNRYCPSWGLSSGLVPAFPGRSFKRQSTDKNAIADLIIDPVDITGDVPKQVFGFIPGYDTEVPLAEIRICASHFVPQALADFDQVSSLSDFCRFFLERSRLEYKRFLFDNYVQHNLVFGFVLILTGKRDEGLERIRKFCRDMDADFDDKILQEAIRYAAELATGA